MGQRPPLLRREGGEGPLAEHRQRPAVGEAQLHGVGRHGHGPHRRHRGVAAPHDPGVAAGAVVRRDGIVPPVGDQAGAGPHGGVLRPLQHPAEGRQQGGLPLYPPAGQAHHVGVPRQQADGQGVGKQGGHIGGGQMEGQPPAQPGQRGEHLEHALLSRLAGAVVPPPPHHDIRPQAGVEVALGALHVNAAGLLGHAVVVAYPLHARGRRHPGLELSG